MSVIRRPGVLGRTTHQRVAGVTAALSATAVDAVAVGTWFALLVVRPRTLATALVGLGILLAGSIVRVGVFGAATNDSRAVDSPDRLLSAIGLSTCWIAWLLVAETVGAAGGVFAGAACLVLLLAVQHGLERRFVDGVYRHAGVDVGIGTFVAPSLVALGATALLASTWFVDLSLLSLPLSVAGRSVVLEVGAVSIGFLVFVCCTFLGHQRRFQRRLAT